MARTLLAVLLLCSIPGEDIHLRAVSAYVYAVEINTYGPEADQRTAALFRDTAGNIIDWRWWGSSQYAGAQPRPNGRYTYENELHWTEKGRDRIIVFKKLYRTRTLYDVELKERQEKPRHQRRGLFPRKKAHDGT